MNITYILLILFLIIPSIAYSHSVRRYYEIRGKNGSQTFVAPTVDGANVITFVSVMTYDPAKDDDYDYKIEPDDDGISYVVTTSKGNTNSVLGVDITSIPLPDYVTPHRDIVRHSPADLNVVPLRLIPAGRSGIVIVEMLEYQPQGDQDFSYWISTNCRAPALFVTYNNVGNYTGEHITFRVTTLEWPSEQEPRNIETNFRNMRAEEKDRPGVARDLIAMMGTAIASPTTYWTKGDDDMSFRIGYDQKQNSWRRVPYSIDTDDTNQGWAEMTACVLDVKSERRPIPACERCEGIAVSACAGNDGVSRIHFSGTPPHCNFLCRNGAHGPGVQYITADTNVTCYSEYD